MGFTDCRRERYNRSLETLRLFFTSVVSVRQRRTTWRTPGGVSLGPAEDVAGRALWVAVASQPPPV